MINFIVNYNLDIISHIKLKFLKRNLYGVIIGDIILIRRLIKMKKIVDGNLACSKIAYLFTEICSIYPITPSSPMSSNIDYLTEGANYNLYHAKPKVIEMQSEAGAVATMHGALLTGSLATTFTSSQGLLLMLPNMYKMAGEMLPGVIHVAARSIATHSLSIFGDHQDVYAARSTGFCILSSTNVFDAQNLAAVAHLSAIEGSLPFIHFFDGFRTSHEINTIEELDEREVLKLINYAKIKEYKNRVLNLNSKKQYGMAQNEDIYFQVMESRNTDYLKMPDIVNEYMQKINQVMKTDYKPFNYYGQNDAENIIIAMGSVCDTIKEVINNSDEKIGLIEVHLYRPFSLKYLLNVLPESVKNIAVLERTKEAGSIGEPLYLDVIAALQDKGIQIVGGRYGLSSKNTTPSDINDVYHMLKTEAKNNFTIGITDDITHLSLEKVPYKIVENTNNIKIYGFGSDGMVSASKDLINLIHHKEGLYVQGYFEYDSKKSGGVTVSNLRISEKPINKPYYVTENKLIAVTKLEYFQKYNIINELENNGILLINTYLKGDNLLKSLPSNVLKYLMEKNIKVYYIDADGIAKDSGIPGKISKIMENVILLLIKKGYSNEIIEVLQEEFKTKGEAIIENNIKAIHESKNSFYQLEITSESVGPEISEETSIFEIIRNRKGYTLKVSDVLPFKDGAIKNGLSKEEKRNTANMVPEWIPENCIQCAQCSFVCPHAVIRPIVKKDGEGIPLLGNDEYSYAIKISAADCTSCGLCVEVCPGKMGDKALKLVKNENREDVKNEFENHENPELVNKFTIKGSQFQKPLFEFSGACAGCGETAYIKLLTQLYGKNILIANATGCSSIYGGSMPSTPYLIPWANSLFEDNAEFALGMHISYKERRERIKSIIMESINSVDTEVKNIFEDLLNNFENGEITLKIKEELKDKVIPNELKDLIEDVPTRTIWGIGGDGWAYDIGYGGLDHVLHTSENIKFLVLDTEVYSNTGGQASKSTKLGAVAEFANMGKKTNKKDLFKLAMAIPNCYVASISLGANMMHTLKVFKEAQEHNGPALIIAYSPCIEHGIKNGLTCSLASQKLAIESGYLLLMRYNQKELIVDSLEPNFDKYLDYLNNETRFKALLIKDEEKALELFNQQKNDAEKRYNYYKNFSQK